MPVVTLIDGTKKVFNKKISILDVADAIKLGLSKICIGGQINQKLVDVYTIIKKDCSVRIITIKDNNTFSLQLIRYTCMQLFSYAVQTLWPKAKLANNEMTDNGFYYDIDHKLKKDDLNIIEKKMYELSRKKYSIIKKIMKNEECKKNFQNLYKYYKYDLLKKNILKKCKSLIVYYHEKHIDFTNGPQLPNIKFCRYFKVQNFSGVYWLGKSQNQILQRVYITVWDSYQRLQLFLKKNSLQANRDHRTIAKRLNLYHMQKESPGMIFWHNNGWIIFRELQKFIREKLKEYEYQEVKTPVMIDKVMWEKSGHWENYKDGIFITASEKRDYCVKPMNCPAHVQIFNQKLRSYKKLPIRIAEFGSCHRNEPSGSLHGLMRVRAFTQDDAHIFCTHNQIYSEINHCIKMIFDVYKIFGFKNIIIKFSSRPEKRIGDDKTWDEAESNLINVLKKNKLDFSHQKGEGAFYGPKIELILKDSLNRTWQCGTIQLDFYLPKRLQSFYIDKDNKHKTPVIIHRAILGSMERFIGILIEEYSGSFPLWLSPVQVIIISIADIHAQYVELLYNKLNNCNIRVKKDIRNVNINIKIKESINYRIPYVLICGNQELHDSTITVRTRSGKIIKNINVDYFIKIVLREINTRNMHQMEE